MLIPTAEAHSALHCIALTNKAELTTLTWEGTVRTTPAPDPFVVFSSSFVSDSLTGVDISV